MKLRYLFLIAILFALCPTAKAACSGSTPNYTAASTSSTDVAACAALATHCGDIINIPSGSSTWSTQVTFTPATGCSANQGLTVVGATVCLTNCSPGSGAAAQTFTDNTNITISANQGLLMTGCAQTSFCTLTGVTLIQGAAQSTSITSFNGTGTHSLLPGFRAHHIHVTNSTSGGIIFNVTGVYGLFDHVTGADTGSTPSTPINPYGDFSNSGYLGWEDTTSPGTSQSVIFEDSAWTFAHSGAEGFFDGYNGMKFTLRYTLITGNQIGGWHGTDSGGRGGVLGEIYNNTVSNSNTSFSILNTRSGVLYFFNNTVSGNFTAIPLQFYRIEQPSPQEQTNWGAALQGVNWVPIKASTGSTCGNADCTSFVTANAPNWVANQAHTCSTSSPCVIGPTTNNAGAGNGSGLSGGYNFYTTTNCTSGGTAPTWNQTVNSTGTTTTDGTCAWHNIGGGTTASPAPGTAFGFQTANPDTPCSSGACARPVDNNGGTYPFRDQPGFAHNQVSTPNYAWNNTISGVVPALSVSALLADGGSGTVNSGRDYFNNTTAPGYTPYTYPDPLQNAVSISPTSNNFGSVNVGSSSSAVTFTLTNNSGVGMTAISASFTGGNSSDFSNTGAGTCSTTLSNSASCTYTLIFSPSGTGARATTFSVSYSGGDGNGPQTSALSGTGVGAASPVAHCPKCFMAVNVEPLPATAIPTLTNVSHPATYLTSQGFTQNGTTFSPTLSETLTGTGFGATTECFWDATIVAGVLTGGTQVPCSCGSPTSCTATISASLVAIPSTNTSHMLGVSNPTAAVPILQ